MHGSKKNLPTTLNSKEVVFQEIEWGDIHIAFEAYHEPLDIRPFFEGLPDRRCQCPHWGYVVKGRMKVEYADREEIVEAGEVYYIAPGHVPVMQPGTEIVEFSPTEEYRKTSEVVQRNFEAMHGSSEAPAS